MARVVANNSTQAVKKDLANDEEQDAEYNSSEWPAVLEGPHHEDDLQDDVDKELDSVQQIKNREKANGLCGSHASPIPKGRERDEEGQRKGDDGANPEHPDRQGGAVLVELKANKAVDQETGDEGGRKSVLYRYEVGIRVVTWGDDTGIDEQREEGQEHVRVKEGEYFLAA